MFHYEFLKWEYPQTVPSIRPKMNTLETSRKSEVSHFIRLASLSGYQRQKNHIHHTHSLPTSILNPLNPDPARVRVHSTTAPSSPQSASAAP